MITLTMLCREVNNWFERSRYSGLFKITNGSIDLNELVTDNSLQSGQYFRIMGSVFNDGVHQYPASDLTDETFTGIVCPMAVPADFIGLLNEINAWLEKYGNNDAVNSPFASESFGGYSYSKASSYAGSGTGDSSDPTTWMGHFKGKLNKWRKLR